VPPPQELHAQYLTGECSELISLFPELGFFRDIVFTFKALMAPTSDALPEIKVLTPPPGPDCVFRRCVCRRDHRVVFECVGDFFLSRTVPPKWTTTSSPS